MRLNPIAEKRLKRFVAHRRGFFSFCLLLGVYLVSLFAELLCNGVPLMVRFQGRCYFPVFRFYPESTFVPGGSHTRMDYRRLRGRADCRMVWPLIPFGPNDISSAEELTPYLKYTFRLAPVPQVTTFSVDSSLKVVGEMGTPWPGGAVGRPLQEIIPVSKDIQDGIERRFANQDAEALRGTLPRNGESGEALVSLSRYSHRANAPRRVRVTLRVMPKKSLGGTWNVAAFAVPPRNALPNADVLVPRFNEMMKRCHQQNGALQSANLDVDGIPCELTLEREQVQFPFRPVKGHPLGLDDAGRDVLARLLYAFRTSLTFGLLLTVCSMSLGSLAGMAQGYLGGWIDLGGQRLLEIWSALPFLYIVILLGSIYGPGFWLMLFCYAIFNWISLSYYMRAEMLRLRKQPFVEAARCLGLPWWRIMFRHILPNSLVPIITFFPFSLVGAIGSLAALDYLGFGLPPPTPSIGQLLQQAQSHRWAWWLILYPSLLLFAMMLFGVFIGEGVRDAFDPRRQSRLE